MGTLSARDSWLGAAIRAYASRAAVPLAAIALAACKPGGDTGSDWSYPQDGVLRFGDLQAKGTHNSYHVETPGVGRPEWAYSHPSLDVQAGAQGVRQYELDAWWDAEAGAFDVYHVPALDQTVNCTSLPACFWQLRVWSDANRAHHPLLVMIEPKSGYEEGAMEDRFAAIEGDLLAAWPRERIITPDEVQGDAETLRDALADGGWPTLGALRGRLLVVLHETGDWRDAYTDGGTSTRGRLLFPDAGGDVEAPYAAFHAINDPIGQATRIGEAVQAGQLVRTRADADCVEPAAGDTARREAAFASGAHFVSTDFPAAVDGVDYVVQIPAGTPSRCNPVTAPPGCASEDIENPAFVGP